MWLKGLITGHKILKSHHRFIGCFEPTLPSSDEEIHTKGTYFHNKTNT